MKVLSITPGFFPSIGGIGQVVYEIAKRSVNFGVQVDIAHVDKKYKIFSQDVFDDLKVFRVPLNGFRLLGLAPEIKNLVSNYDLLHVHDPQLMSISANAKIFGGRAPKVLSTHGGFWHTKNHFFLKKIYEISAMRYTLKSYSKILASSVGDFEYMKKYSNNVVLCENGVSIEKFQNIVDSQVENLTNWIYWGRISRNKRIDQIIDVVSYVKDQGRGIKLSICGDDFDGVLGELTRKVSELNIEDCVEFIPFLSDELLIKKISQCSVVVSASEHEGFGLSVIEAMSAGRVVLCRDISPLNSFVDAGISGFFLNFDGSSHDRNVIDRLLSLNKQLLSSISGNARKVAGRYKWDIAMNNFMDNYRLAVKGE